MRAFSWRRDSGSSFKFPVRTIKAKAYRGFREMYFDRFQHDSSTVQMPGARHISRSAERDEPSLRVAPLGLTSFFFPTHRSATRPIKPKSGLTGSRALHGGPTS